jgi:hypothetical protein
VIVKKLFKDIANRQARKATEQLHEHLQDVSRRIASDQAIWLDKVMKDILPPMLYEAGKHEEKSDEVEAYLRKHKFQLVFIPDSMAVRVMRGNQVHAEFVPQFTVDGEPVTMHRTGPELN